MTVPVRSTRNLTIRRAGANDARLLAELGARTFSETFAANNSEADMADYLAAAFNETQQAKDLADPRTTIHIAEVDGTAVGYAMLRSGSVPAEVRNDKPIELVRLYVSQQHIGSGVGAALMQVCIEEASALGYRTLWLGVWENNSPAQTFYRKWGFRQVGTHIFQLGGDAQTDLLMERQITSVRR
ncbi:MAG TPA: GNAT family N-acetyltransferase [Pyrinomonadaceae bacterium]|nr:GNAT family N-acetyltransferase [Pyrinomonadaceae bacterium]